MAINLFISYSHKDESHKDSLIEVLTPLKRQGLISVWNDRDINAGEQWKHEISSNLTHSNVILFLISPSFLASDYCYEIEYLKSGKLPLYLQAKEIKRSALNDLIEGSLNTQYKNLTKKEYLSLPNKVLLIDDLSDIGLNAKYRSKLLAEINEKFTDVVISASSSFSFVAAEINELAEFKNFTLLDLGHEKRAELIEKWVALGNEECISEEELFRTCDEIKARLDAIVRRNIVPAKPIYILMLLQMFEAYSQQNLELTSYGHCYQELIYQSFRNSGIQQREVNQYLNVLTELAWAIHLNNDGLNQKGLDDFFDRYETTYLKVDRVTVLSKLRKNSILVEQDYKVHFKYPYLFYFFAAKKIADYYLNDVNIQNQLRCLLENLHREDYANILVFVTHHTKDSWILDEIRKTLKTLFNDCQKATLAKSQLAFMDEFIRKIPALVMEQREIRNERLEHNKRLDRLEQDEEKSEEEFDGAEILANINKTFKGMEIAGQIIRNRHASMTRESLYMLAEEGSGTGLRFLDYFINLTDLAKSEVIKYIEFALKEHPNLTDKQVQDYAQDIFTHLTYGVVNGVIRKIAASIGSKEASEIYDQLEKHDSSPAIVLLRQAINLKFNRSLSVEEITKTSDKLKNNPVCIRILKELVIQHTYMFPVGYKEKQQLCEILDISVQGQRLMDLKKAGKG